MEGKYTHNFHMYRFFCYNSTCLLYKHHAMYNAVIKYSYETSINWNSFSHTANGSKWEKNSLNCESIDSLLTHYIVLWFFFYLPLTIGFQLQNTAIELEMLRTKGANSQVTSSVTCTWEKVHQMKTQNKYLLQRIFLNILSIQYTLTLSNFAMKLLCFFWWLV